MTCSFKPKEKYNRIAELRADVESLLTCRAVDCPKHYFDNLTDTNTFRFNHNREIITRNVLKKLKGAGFAPAWATELLKLYE